MGPHLTDLNLEPPNSKIVSFREISDHRNFIESLLSRCNLYDMDVYILVKNTGWFTKWFINRLDNSFLNGVISISFHNFAQS